MERSAWIDLISLNLRLNVDAELDEQFADIVRLNVVVVGGLTLVKSDIQYISFQKLIVPYIRFKPIRI